MNGQVLQIKHEHTELEELVYDGMQSHQLATYSESHGRQFTEFIGGTPLWTALFIYLSIYPVCNFQSSYFICKLLRH